MKTPPVAKRGVMDMYVSLFFVPMLTSIKSVPCAGVRVYMCVCKVCKVCVTLYVEGGEGWENTSTFFVIHSSPAALHSYTCPALTC